MNKLRAALPPIKYEKRLVHTCSKCKHVMELPLGWKDSTGAPMVGRTCLALCGGIYAAGEIVNRQCEAAYGCVSSTGVVR
jgi:hypothetical protein